MVLPPAPGAPYAGVVVSLLADQSRPGSNLRTDIASSGNRNCEHTNGQPSARSTSGLDRAPGGVDPDRLHTLARTRTEAARESRRGASRHGRAGDARRYAGHPERTGHRHADRHGHRRAEPGGKRLSDRRALQGRAGRGKGPIAGSDRSPPVPGGARPGHRNAPAR